MTLTAYVKLQTLLLEVLQEPGMGIRFDQNDHAHRVLVKAGGKVRRTPYSATETISVVELKIDKSLELSAQTLVPATDEDRSQLDGRKAATLSRMPEPT